MGLTLKNSNGSVGRFRMYLNTPTPVDPDAQAFITAAGITNPTQQSAINTLVIDLKGYSLWTKMKAIYPMVGGTSTTCKYNLKDPRDLDAAYRLVFFGGWTFSNTGALPNGVNAYADTFLTQIAAGAFNNSHLSYYSRTNNINSNFQVEIGMGMPANSNSFFNLFLRLNNSNLVAGGNAGSRSTSANNSTSACFGINSATSSTLQKIYINGNLISTGTSTQTESPFTAKIFVGSQGANSVPSEYSSRECAFASIGDGLTDTEATNLYTAVQAYQTTLGRQI
jgi:hypothetical protein